MGQIGDILELKQQFPTALPLTGASPYVAISTHSAIAPSSLAYAALVSLRWWQKPDAVVDVALCRGTRGQGVC
jgi:hypothetical protein